jgi:hypothetical protein
MVHSALPASAHCTVRRPCDLVGICVGLKEVLWLFVVATFFEAWPWRQRESRGYADFKCARLRSLPCLLLNLQGTLCGRNITFFQLQIG